MSDMDAALMAIAAAGSLRRAELAQAIEVPEAKVRNIINTAITARWITPTPESPAINKSYMLTASGRTRIGRQAAPAALTPVPPLSVDGRTIDSVVQRRHVPNSVFDVARLALPDAGVDEPPASAPAPAPAEHRLGLVSTVPAAGAVEAASEVVDAAPPTPPAPQALPLVGELDIDAADHAAAALPSFSCAFFSTGALQITSWGQCLVLKPDHARELLRYIDSLRGNEYVEDVLGEL